MVIGSSAPPTCIGNTLPSNVIKAAGFFSACLVRYSTPPASSSAARIIAFTSALSLFFEPLRRPFPAAGGRVPLGAAISSKHFFGENRTGRPPRRLPHIGSDPAAPDHQNSR